MTGDEFELVEYFQRLMEHAKECGLEDCPSCLTLHGIFQLIRNRLFTSPLYPEVAIAAGASRSRTRQAVPHR